MNSSANIHKQAIKIAATHLRLRLEMQDDTVASI